MLSFVPLLYQVGSSEDDWESDRELLDAKSAQKWKKNGAKAKAVARKKDKNKSKGKAGAATRGRKK